MALAATLAIAASLVGCKVGPFSAKAAFADSAPSYLQPPPEPVPAEEAEEPATAPAEPEPAVDIPEEAVAEAPPSDLGAEWLPRETAQVAYAVDDVLHFYDEPDGEIGWSLPNPTQFDGPRVTVILDTVGDWHLVSVPVRPNATTGWVKAADVEIEQHEFRARVNLTTRRVVVWNGDELVADTGVVIGAPATPTPVGTFYVRDKIREADTGPYGPWIIALSGFSEALETFNGGLPAIAIHGTNRPDLIGGAHSNGCIRIPNDLVQLLADQVPLGTPVEIVS